MKARLVLGRRAAFYQWFLGPFPFPEVNIIQVNTYGYGQAPPGTIFITNEAFNSTLGELALLQFVTKKDYTPFFNQYYWGTAMPE